MIIIAEKIEIDRWLIPKRKGGKYTSYHRVYIYDDDSLGCSCADWREKNQKCAHIIFVANKKKEIQYIELEEHKKGYKGWNRINQFSRDLPLRELKGVNLDQMGFYLASSIKIKETKVNDEISLNLVCIGYELRRPETRKESRFPSYRGVGPTYNDYRFAVNIHITAKGIEDDYFILLDLVPYKKVKGATTFVWEAALNDKIEAEFEEVVSKITAWIKAGYKGSFEYPSIAEKMRSSLKGIKFPL